MIIPGLTASDVKVSAILTDDDHKFLQNSGMSIQHVYNFIFKGCYIPAMKNLMEETGREKFLAKLKISSDKIYSPGNTEKTDYRERTLAVFADNTIKAFENMENRLTFRVIRESENELEMELTECLWAKTFREAGAEDMVITA